jgi:hypothetical protein
MSEPSLRASSKKSGQDLIVGLCGFVTSLLTAVILWWVEAKFGLALYTWMFWFVIPVGALLAGFAGASGYLAGSWFFGHRPTRLLLLNIVLASVATFLLIHFLSYMTLQIDGKRVSDYIPFTRYLDIAIRSTSMDFRLRTVRLGSTGELGAFGYVVAFLQVCGFAAGGLAVYGHLMSLPYCEKCSRYLSAKGRQERYTADAEGFKSAWAQVLDSLNAGGVAAAISRHAAFGSATNQKNCHLRSVVRIRYCKMCGQHWARFVVEKRNGSTWKEIPELSVASFTNEPVTVA